MSNSTKLPYVVQPGMISKVLAKIKEAKTPERFTQDYLQTKLGFKGGNYRQFIPLAKKMGFLHSDGKPTSLYQSYRNPNNSRAAMAQAVRSCYREIFDRNEFAGDLPKEDIKGMVVEVTGLDAKDQVVGLIVRTFEGLRGEADFEKAITEKEDSAGLDVEKEKEIPSQRSDQQENVVLPKGLDLRLGYTINIVLPKSDDVAVFNAIFKALKDNILR